MNSLLLVLWKASENEIFSHVQCHELPEWVDRSLKTRYTEWNFRLVRSKRGRSDRTKSILSFRKRFLFLSKCIGIKPSRQRFNDRWTISRSVFEIGEAYINLKVSLSFLQLYIYCTYDHDVKACEISRFNNCVRVCRTVPELSAIIFWK